MQRKLDELLRASPGAHDSLMLLEDAPPEELLDVEEERRGGQTGVNRSLNTSDATSRDA